MHWLTYEIVARSLSLIATPRMVSAMSASPVDAAKTEMEDRSDWHFLVKNVRGLVCSMTKYDRISDASES